MRQRRTRGDRREKQTIMKTEKEKKVKEKKDRYDEERE